MKIIKTYYREENGGENWKQFYVVEGDRRQELFDDLNAHNGKEIESMGIYNDANSATPGGEYHGKIIVDGLDDCGNTIICQHCGYNI